jgi:hypothetical protein
LLPLEIRVAVLESENQGLKEDIHDLKMEVQGLRKALWGFAFSILLGALTFSLTVIQLH